MSSYDIIPNKTTYTAMIYGYCKSGDMKDAAKLLAEMVGKGMVLDTVTYNMLTYSFYKEVM